MRVVVHGELSKLAAIVLHPFPTTRQQWMLGKALRESTWFDSPVFPRRQRSYWIGSITFHLHQGNKGALRGERMQPCCITNTPETATQTNKQTAVALQLSRPDKTLGAAACVSACVHFALDFIYAVCMLSTVIVCSCAPVVSFSAVFPCRLFCLCARGYFLAMWSVEIDRSKVCMCVSRR